MGADLARCAVAVAIVVAVAMAFAVAVASAAAAAAAKTVTSAESIFVRVFPFSLESLFDQSLVLDVDAIIDAPLATKNDLESDETFEISSDDIPNGFNVVTIFADSA